MKQRTLSRASVILLLSALLLTSCTSAGEQGEGDTDRDTSAVITDPAELYPLPTETFGGKEFRMLVLRTGYWGQDYNDLWAENDSGDSVDSASFLRKTQIEDQYGIRFSQTESDDAVGTISTLYYAGDDAYELVQAKGVELLSNLSSNGMLHNVYEIGTLHTDAPWYNHKLNDSMTIARKLYMLGGDAEVSDKIGIAAMMFNKKLVADYQLPDLYALVDSGDWTFDRLMEYSRLATKDENGDGVYKKQDDSFGLIAEDFYGWFFLVSGGHRIAEKDADDIPYFTVSEESAVSMLTKIEELMFDETRRTGKGFDAQDFNTIFSSNRALFHANVLSTIATFRDMDTDFGIIPMPKMDAGQAEYITTISPYVSRFLAFPSVSTETEFSGTVVELLSRFGTDTVKKAYYDVLLNGKIARDEESSSMLSLIFDSVVLDIGSAYNWGDCWFFYNTYFHQQQSGFASEWAKIESKAQTALEDSLARYTETQGN